MSDGYIRDVGGPSWCGVEDSGGEAVISSHLITGATDVSDKPGIARLWQ